MTRWIWAVLPPGIYLIGALALYLVPTGIATSLSWFSDHRPAAEKSVFPLMTELTGLLGAIAVSYGAFRGSAFHPAHRPKYREWLVTTPWRVGLPLPIGPLHLVVQDVLYVGILTALSRLHADVPWSAIPGVFLFGYLFTIATGLVGTGQYRHAYVAALVLSGVLTLKSHYLAVLLILAGLYPILWHGVDQSLRVINFWDSESLRQLQIAFSRTTRLQEVSRTKLLGWPFERLAPQSDPNPIRGGWIIAVAFLAGWWSFVMLSFLPPSVRRVDEIVGPLAILAAVVVGFACLRVARYVVGYLPPINLLGRLFTFRWIIPGYDVIFLAPLLMAALYALSLWIIVEFNVPIRLGLPITVFLEALAFLACPPSLHRWRLTGNHRIISTAFLQTAELKQTQ